MDPHPREHHGDRRANQRRYAPVHAVSTRLGAYSSTVTSSSWHMTAEPTSPGGTTWTIPSWGIPFGRSGPAAYVFSNSAALVCLLHTETTVGERA